jgi:lipopolysaccharide export system ATP-binding protein
MGTSAAVADSRPRPADGSGAEDGRAVLAVEGLRKQYGRTEAVADVSFAMRVGEVVGLLGPNGAGKTTVFYMIVGFIRPTAGRIYLDGQNISTFPMFRRARHGIAYLPQEASVFRRLTVEQNIMAVLQSRRDLSRADRNARTDELLEELGIEKVRRQRAYSLSGGERRRTEIARALAIRPKFLLLDEPFAGIDPIAVQEIKAIVERLAQRGIGILITDHNVRDTMEITARSYIIRLGEIMVSGSRDELLANELARELYLGKDFRM